MIKRLLVVLALGGMAFANTPGQHSVTLSWNASTTPGVTYNIYKGTAKGVCNGSPTPYATGINALQYVDTVGLTDGQTIFYNVSDVGTGGAESACDGEVQVLIPVLPSPPSNLQAAPK